MGCFPRSGAGRRIGSGRLPRAGSGGGARVGVLPARLALDRDGPKREGAREKGPNDREKR
jgi:hypothetical protein